MKMFERAFCCAWWLVITIWFKTEEAWYKFKNWMLGI